MKCLFSSTLPVFTRDTTKSAPDMNEYVHTVREAGFKIIVQVCETLNNDYSLLQIKQIHQIKT